MPSSLQPKPFLEMSKICCTVGCRASSKLQLYGIMTLPKMELSELWHHKMSRGVLQHPFFIIFSLISPLIYGNSPQVPLWAQTDHFYFAEL